MKYVALLRGISPMNAPNVKLRDAFKALGFSDIQSVISSGNIIFESYETNTTLLEQKIEKELLDRLNLASSTIVKSAEQIAEVVASHPFKDQVHSTKTYLTVTFFKNTPHKNPELLFERAAYLPRTKILCSTNDISTREASNFMAKLEREFGKGITTRTWNTVVKIYKKLVS